MKKLLVIPDKLYEDIKAEAEKINIPVANYIVMVLSEHINTKKNLIYVK